MSDQTPEGRMEHDVDELAERIERLEGQIAEAHRRAQDADLEDSDDGDDTA
jgi:hypothetical protein